MFTTAAEYAEQIDELIDASDAICQRAIKEGRDLTNDESRKCEANTDKARSIQILKDNAAMSESRSSKKLDEKLPLILGGQESHPSTSNEAYSTVHDISGKKTAYAFNRSQKIADGPFQGVKSECSNPVGALVQAAITGKRGGLDAPLLNVMSEGTDSAGGYTVPTVLSSSIIDKARAASVMARAGVQTFVTDSDNLTVAKVTGDATVETKAENVAFVGSDLTFGAVNFTPFLTGIHITASRELAEDGINMAAMIEDKLSRALSAGIDQLALAGSGSGETLGLLNDTGIGQTTSAGVVTWQKISSEVDTIRQANYEPNAYVLEPGIAHVVNETVDSNGVWLTHPPTLNGIMQLPTSNCESGEMVVGDFSQAAWCVRSGVRLELSTEAGDAFSKHQIAIKMYVRMDFASLNDAAFRRVSGLTAS